jgi:hypothetical protein
MIRETFELGAYARWIYGSGRQQSFDGSRAATSRLVSLMARRPRADITKIGAAPMLLTPTLWQGERDGDGFVDLPLLMRTTSARGCANSGPAAIAADLGSALGRWKQAEFRINTPVPESSLNAGFCPTRIEKRLCSGGGHRAPPAAIMAVIDDGIAFAHRDLQGSDGRSRLACLWLQGVDAPCDEAEHSVLVGRELLGADIQASIDSAAGDEDRLYAAIGSERGAFSGATTRRFGTHGSHVLGAAGGYAGARKGGTAALDDLALIAVQLPAPTTIDTTGLGKDFFVLSAFHYIFDRADRLARLHGLDNLPLVINFSYGFSGGPHDGSDLLERAINALVKDRNKLAPTHLVMPAGNDFESRLFGEISTEMLTARGSNGGAGFAVPWRLQPNDRTPNYLEIWLPEGADFGRMNLALRDPPGRIVLDQRPGALKASRHIDLATGTSAPFGQVSFEICPTGTGTARRRIVIALAPTAKDHPAHPTAASGLWRLELTKLTEILASGPIACRIQRDINPFGYAVGARQSYFDDPVHGGDPRRPNRAGPGAFVQRYGTINGLATHDAVTVVGGYVGSTLRPAFYSSAAEVALSEAALAGVHCVARSETNPAVLGVLGAGTRSGSVFRLSGTSTAAPQVARAMASAYLNGQGAPRAEGLPGLLNSHWRPFAGGSIPDYDDDQARARLGAGYLV